MSEKLPPCDHDECGPTGCTKTKPLAPATGSVPISDGEDGDDEVFTPMPKSCQRFACREHHPILENRNGFMVCPRCGCSWGKAENTELTGKSGLEKEPQ